MAPSLATAWRGRQISDCGKIPIANAPTIMDITIFFARFYGGFFLIFGLLFILARFLGRVIEMTDDKAFVISTGYLTLMLGLATVILHNVWVADWPVAITILGWSTFIKGIMKVGFPGQINRQAQAFKKKQWLSAILLILMGGGLIWASL
jgi:hypothetical protein